ncbi:MAG: hypothetical protein NTZ80_01595 [Patescibacteria group bacterium]|nr:hypothetical protein [Patescibacteria group bacterium]
MENLSQADMLHVLGAREAAFIVRLLANNPGETPSLRVIQSKNGKALVNLDLELSTKDLKLLQNEIKNRAQAKNERDKNRVKAEIAKVPRLREELGFPKRSPLVELTPADLALPSTEELNRLIEARKREIFDEQN